MNNRPVKMASGETGSPRAEHRNHWYYSLNNISGTLLRNVTLVLEQDFQGDGGMKALIECFYRSIRENAPVPIRYREILLTSSIIDSIVHQLRDRGHDQLAAQASTG